MKKKILVILLLTCSTLFAQNKEREQGIELPDFVITGVQSVDVPSILKKKAALIPVIGNKFLIPRFEPENLNLVKVDAPFYNAPKVFEHHVPFNYSINLVGGLYTLPSGALFVSKNLQNVMLSGEVSGKNILNYQDNSGNIYYSGRLNADIYNSYKSSFLPGVLLGIEAFYENHTYKFFASPTPALERNRQNVNLKLKIDYDRDRFINFAVSANGEYLWLAENNASNMAINSNALVKFILPGFDLKFGGEIKHSKFADDIVSDFSDDYLTANANVVFRLMDGLMIGGGMHLSSLDTNTFVFPNVMAVLKVNKFITLAGEIGGYGNYLSFSDLIKLNRYYRPTSTYSIYAENNLKLHFSVKYEFDKYFELTGGVGFAAYNDYFYFEDNLTKGFFEVHPAQDVKQIYIYGKSYFHLGPLGAFYGSLMFQQFTFENGNNLPYEPMLGTSIDYRYKTSSKIGFGIRYTMLYDIFYDSVNSGKMESAQNLSLELSYEVMENMELNINLQNILNKDNFMWNDYNEKPFDVLIGFNYKW